MPVGSSPLVLVFLARGEVEAFASSCSTHSIGVQLFLGELRLGGWRGKFLQEDLRLSGAS